MRTRVIVLKSLIFSGLLLLILPAFSLSAEDNRGGGLNVSVSVTQQAVEPGEVRVDPGTTVIWVNHAQSPIRVVFRSQAVSTTCKAPVGFNLSASGIYSSKAIGEGGIASLCFLERMNYEYEVEFLSAVPTETAPDQAVTARLQGTIHVE